MATVRDKCLDKMEKALNLWVEDRSRKCVSIEGSVLQQKAPSQHEDFSKGSPEMTGTSHLLQVRDGHTDCGLV